MRISREGAQGFADAIAVLTAVRALKGTRPGDTAEGVLGAVLGDLRLGSWERTVAALTALATLTLGLVEDDDGEVDENAWDAMIAVWVAVSLTAQDEANGP